MQVRCWAAMSGRATLALRGVPLSVSAHLHLLREQHAQRQLVRRPRSFTRFVEIRQHEAAIEGIIRRL